MVGEGVADGLELERDLRDGQSCGRCSACPSPAERVAHDAGTDGVVGEVVADAEQILVARDLAGEVVGPEQVSAALPASICEARVHGVKALQCRRESGVGDLHDRVVVGSHQRVGDDGDLEALEGSGELGEEAQALGVGLKQEPCIARSRSDVVQARKEGPSASRHSGKRMGERRAGVATEQ